MNEQENPGAQQIDRGSNWLEKRLGGTPERGSLAWMHFELSRL